MRSSLFVIALAGGVAVSAFLGGTKPVRVPFEPNLENAVKKASLRNLPLLFVIGKDH